MIFCKLLTRTMTPPKISPWFSYFEKADKFMQYENKCNMFKF